MRLRRVKGTRERLESYQGLLVFEPQNYKGRWHECFGNDNEIILEIGCGKGNFLINSAKANPDKNYIGVEVQEEIIMEAIKKLDADYKERLYTKKNFVDIPHNMRFLWLNAKNLNDIFAVNEIRAICLNFSDPWPKKRHYKRRLTYLDFLKIYSSILSDNGEIRLKTDNRQLFDFSLEQFWQADFAPEDIDYDYPLQGAIGDVPTEYETRFRRLGNPIYRCVAKKINRIGGKINEVCRN